MILWSLYLSYEFKDELLGYLSRLFTNAPHKLSLRKLEKITSSKRQKQNEAVFLGYGFVFTPKHARLLDSKLKKSQNTVQRLLTLSALAVLMIWNFLPIKSSLSLRKS